jgi:hypothetical protein
MKLFVTILTRVRRLFWWQLTVSEVSFITEDGVDTVLHVHPAWWGKQRVFEDALYSHIPSHYAGGDE